jgi:hypothetical protein
LGIPKSAEQYDKEEASVVNQNSSEQKPNGQGASTQHGAADPASAVDQKPTNKLQMNKAHPQNMTTQRPHPRWTKTTTTKAE